MLPFRYKWFDELSMEIVTFTFFAMTAYKFQPASNNPYLKVNDTDELDLAEINQLLIEEDSFNENTENTVLDMINHDYYVNKDLANEPLLQPCGPNSANPNLLSRKQMFTND
jgi:hypothetical protein